MQSKKSQAAMEFLMTYGWAILTVVVALSALAYFGVLDPGKAFIVKRCIMPPEITCRDFELSYTPSSDSNNFKIYLQNNRGYRIQLESISIGNKNQNINNIQLNNSDSALITVPSIRFNTKGIPTGNSYNIDVTLKYTNLDTFLTHTYLGKIIGPSVS